MNIIKIKNYLNTLLITLIITVSILLIISVKNNIEFNAIQNNVSQAQHATNQLIVLRSHLANMASKIKIIDDKVNAFSLTPAYVGAKISEDIYKKYGFYVKQTSLKYRNPANSPDDDERRTLQKYLNEEIKGEFWEVSTMNGKEALRYYKPLYIEKSCLQCHGKPNIDVKPEVYNKLVRLYGDKSFNYKLNDLRGAISVAIPMEKTNQQNEALLKNIFIFMSVIIILILIYFFIQGINKNNID